MPLPVAPLAHVVPGGGVAVALPALLVAAAGLLWAAGAWGRRARGGPRLGRRDAALLAALAAVAVALASPLEHHALERFSWHMVQHLLLTIVAAPLLVAARPASLLRWALPAAARRATGRWWGSLRRRGRGAGAAALAAAAWLLYAVTLWAWHVPALHDAALRDGVLHAVEHATLLAAAVALWAVIAAAGAAGGLPGPAVVLVVFTTGLHGAALGLLLAASPQAWYAYPVADAVADQRLAGLLMWVPSGVVYVAVAIAVFLRWIGTESPGPAPPPRPAPQGDSARSRLVSRR